MTTIAQDNKNSFSSKFLQFYKDRTLLAILLSLFAVMFVYGIFFTDNYLTITNFKAIIRDAALYGIMAIGLTFVTLSGNFFLLSLKETASICGVTFAMGMATGFGSPDLVGNFLVSLLLFLACPPKHKLLTLYNNFQIIGLKNLKLLIFQHVSYLLYFLLLLWVCCYCMTALDVSPHALKLFLYKYLFCDYRNFFLLYTLLIFWHF